MDSFMAYLHNQQVDSFMLFLNGLAPGIPPPESSCETRRASDTPRPRPPMSLHHRSVSVSTSSPTPTSSTIYSTQSATSSCSYSYYVPDRFACEPTMEAPGSPSSSCGSSDSGRSACEWDESEREFLPSPEPDEQVTGLSKPQVAGRLASYAASYAAAYAHGGYAQIGKLKSKLPGTKPTVKLKHE